MTTRSRRTLGVLLLSVWALQGCYVMRPTPGPVPNQRIDAVVLRDGNTVRFPRRSPGALEDSLVVAREPEYNTVVRSVRVADIQHVLIREASAGLTVLVLAGVVAAVVFIGGAIAGESSMSGPLY